MMVAWWRVGERWRVPLCTCLLAFCALLGITPAQAASIDVGQARAILENRTYLLNARITFNLSEEVLNAVRNGVSLPINIEAEVYNTRVYVWDQVDARVKYRLVLQYHQLSRQFIVSNLTTGALESFRTLPAALDYLGRVDRIPLVEQGALDPELEYSVRLRVSIAVDSLPVPLRLRAYIYPSWRLSSDWYDWRL